MLRIVDRILRLLSTIGFCTEVGPQVYAANDRTNLHVQFGVPAMEKYQYFLSLFHDMERLKTDKILGLTHDFPW